MPARRTLLGWLMPLIAGCLDPLVDDTPSYSPHVLPANAVLGSVADDPVRAARIEANDGLDGSPVPLRVGFAAGVQVRYWDFGTAPRTLVPMWRFYRCDADGGPLPGEAGEVGHPPLIDAVPGDPAYSPFRTLFAVCVTDRYAGQQIASLAGLEDAVALGLINAPERLDRWGNFPAVLPSVVLEVGAGQPDAPPREAYYEGVRATYFALGGAVGGEYTPAAVLVRVSRVHRLIKADDPDFEQVVFASPRREGDGPAATYAPLWEVVNVTVTEEYTHGSAREEAELFTVAGTNLTPVHPEIVSFTATGTMVNWEIQFEEGAL